MHFIHHSEAATKALFTIISVMLHFTGQATDSSRMTFEFMAKKSYLCCLSSVKCMGTFKSMSNYFSVSGISSLKNNQFVWLI